MNYLLARINRVYNHLTFKEKDLINRTRIKMLSFILTLYPIFTLILMITHLVSGETAYFIRVALVFAFTSTLLLVICFTKAWKMVSHMVLLICVLIVYSNLMVYVQGIDIETVQCIWFGCMLSFYMHGSKWGWFYSALFIMPVLIFTIMGFGNSLYLNVRPEEQSALSYVFVVTYNFILIIFLHYYFFKKFNENFLSLTQTKNELKGLNKQLKLSLHEVDQLSNARMQFLSTMSHELRTPLNGVVGMTNILLQDPRKDQEENLALLKFSTDNLLLLINDILDFNKFDSDTFELESVSFDLSALILNNVSSIKQKADEKNIDLSSHIDKKLIGLHVSSDPSRLTQILSNLMVNSIRFTDKGAVSLHAHIKNSSATHLTVRFLVQDTGIGIPPDRQESIFEPYVQASSHTSRNYGGTGLGLPIVQRILTMFNSQVELESKVNVGTKIFFDIQFKYDRSPITTVTKDLNLQTELGHLRVLVAEDNAVNILVIKRTLERWNIVPEIAENGLIALQKFKQGGFDVILMDLHMPTMDGFEATAKIRKMDDPVKSNVPIIALTAKGSQKMVRDVMEASMNDYLSKPFDPEHLYDKLKVIADEVVLK